MQINRLIYFISVANHLNFTKAAKECHLAQPAISQQINSLEQELGFPLFIRNSKNVALTEAGKVFYKEICVVIEGYHAAVNQAESVAFGFTGRITIGLSGGIESLFLPTIFNHFRLLYPNIDISFQKAPFQEIRSQLENQIYDIVFTWPYDLSDVKGFVYHPVFEDQACVMMNSSHPLAQKDVLTRRELASEHNIVVAHTAHTNTYKHFNDFYTRHKITPPKITLVEDQSILTMMIHLNMGISIVPNRVRDLHLPNIVFSKIEGEPHYISIGAAYLEHSTNPCVDLFVKNIII